MYYLDPNPAFELFIFDEHNGSLIYEQPGVNILIQEYTYDGRTPFGLDKINRNVFYTSNQLSSILKRSIDDPVMIEVRSCMNVIMYVQEPIMTLALAGQRHYGLPVCVHVCTYVKTMYVCMYISMYVYVCR